MLVNCVAYQNGKKLADIPVADISDYVSRPDCFVWVALFDPTQEEMDEMALEFKLHPLAVEDGRKGHQRPKIDEYDDSLLAVLQTVEPPPEGAGPGCSSASSTSSSAPITSCRCATGRSRALPTCARAASASRSCCASDRGSFSTR